MRTTDQGRHHEVGFGCFDFGNGGAKIGDIQGEEFDGLNAAAAFGNIFFDPIGSDLAVVVVSSDDVNLLAPFFHGVRNQFLYGLCRCHASTECVAIANAAFVLCVVEVKGFVFGEHGANHFA